VGAGAKKESSMRSIRVFQLDPFVYFEPIRFPSDADVGGFIWSMEEYRSFYRGEKARNGFDVLDADGVIVSTFAITQEGFDHLRRTQSLCLKVPEISTQAAPAPERDEVEEFRAMVRLNSKR
jgi:hypothetical protein